MQDLNEFKSWARVVFACASAETMSLTESKK